ncbi:hypothetical protein BOTBODRAFT_405056 [Botryobasidium botryosum FD-172 SS1]|uniref:Uncharacterized protein n=1 Tax=Botryobasidium botryosum (strain FD-172 SS1) TaxID=930990 RepID=A0A067MDZ7_BOTB1|nr:hypothetical protein BOTBODRAFT_405056 [Botryobasidium botryosum FD-172 SS1]
MNPLRGIISEQRRLRKAAARAQDLGHITNGHHHTNGLTTSDEDGSPSIHTSVRLDKPREDGSDGSLSSAPALVNGSSSQSSSAVDPPTPSTLDDLFLAASAKSLAPEPLVLADPPTQLSRLLQSLQMSAQGASPIPPPAEPTQTASVPVTVTTNPAPVPIPVAIQAPVSAPIKSEAPPPAPARAPTSASTSKKSGARSRGASVSTPQAQKTIFDFVSPFDALASPSRQKSTRPRTKVDGVSSSHASGTSTPRTPASQAKTVKQTKVITPIEKVAATSSQVNSPVSARAPVSAFVPQNSGMTSASSSATVSATTPPKAGKPPVSTTAITPTVLPSNSAAGPIPHSTKLPSSPSAPGPLGRTLQHLALLESLGGESDPIARSQSAAIPPSSSFVSPPRSGSIGGGVTPMFPGSPYMPPNGPPHAAPLRSPLAHHHHAAARAPIGTGNAFRPNGNGSIGQPAYINNVNHNHNGSMPLPGQGPVQRMGSAPLYPTPHRGPSSPIVAQAFGGGRQPMPMGFPSPINGFPHPMQQQHQHQQQHPANFASAPQPQRQAHKDQLLSLIAGLNGTPPRPEHAVGSPDPFVVNPAAQAALKPMFAAANGSPAVMNVRPQPGGARGSGNGQGGGVNGDSASVQLPFNPGPYSMLHLKPTTGARAKTPAQLLSLLNGSTPAKFN